MTSPAVTKRFMLSETSTLSLNWYNSPGFIINSDVVVSILVIPDTCGTRFGNNNVFFLTKLPSPIFRFSISEVSNEQ